MPTIKILAIDDSKTIRLAIKIAFAAEDAEVVAVGKGSEAIARAKQMAANVVLLDHGGAQGEPTGLELCRSLAADPATSKIPLVLLLPPRGGPTPDQIRASGAAATVTKPFDSQDLIDKVAAAISGKKAISAPAPAAPGVTMPAPAAPRPPAPAVPVAASAAAPVVPKPAVPMAAAPRPAAPVAAPVSAPARPAAPTPGPVAVPAASRPVSAPAPAAPAAAAGPRPASGPSPMAARAIPIVVPIPFAPADAPNSRMLERLRAGGAGTGLDPAAIKALLALSREVVEAVVWEVVPDLAEQIVREKVAR